jgi:hypothetical protein
MRVIKANEEDVENEKRALDILIRNGHHDNIIDIMKHGWLETVGQVYFVDMELADPVVGRLYQIRLSQWRDRVARFLPCFLGQRLL